MHRLYVIATPIGNLEDISARALRLLSEVDVIAAEDTRVARVLLSHFGIKNRLISYNEHNRARRIPEILAALATGDVALVSDAGTPAISDPGVELVAAARDTGYQVIAVPGASAVISALSIAGLRATPFIFAGFLPRTEGALRKLLEAQSHRTETLVAFESPQRLRKTLAVAAEVLPNARIAVCRELTKLHEEVFAGTPAEALAHFESPRGEIVLVIEGAADSETRQEQDEASIAKEVAQMRELGLTRAQATALLGSRYGLPHRRAYELWLQSM